MKSLITLCLILIQGYVFAQVVQIEGYVFESGNRGYLNQVKINVINESSKVVVADVMSDKEGFFTFEVEKNENYKLTASKNIFHSKIKSFTTKNLNTNKEFLKVEMKRQPGYVFDATLAPVRESEDIVVDAITGAQIEIYNNTTGKEVLVLKNHPTHSFTHTFQQGNHYTILIRKKGYFTKRIEANVNVNGCILCFEGLGQGGVRPGVADNLTEGNKMGTLVANIELRPIEIDKAIKIENIYYDLDKATIRSESAKELDNIIGILRTNPSLIIELSSHTDSRGNDDYNLDLSIRRATAAVKYILENSDIQKFRIKAKGYGEQRLVNNCSNGVECSEEEHQLNRRTEFKVTGVLSTDPFENLSLKQILEIEKGREMLERGELFGGTEVRADEDMPDDLKEYIKKQQEKKNNVVEPVRQEEVVEIRSATEIVEDEGGVELKIKDDGVIQAETVDNLPGEVNILNDPATDKDSKITQSTALPVAGSSTQIFPIDHTVSGYVITIYDGDKPIDEGHSILQQHGKLYEDNSNGRFRLSVGIFDTEMNAKGFYFNLLQPLYGEAKIVKYEEGKITAFDD